MRPSSTPADVMVPPRDIRFDVVAARGHWLGGDPVGTAVFNALSLTFPDGERMFIDAVRHYRHGVSGKLAEDVKGFIAQEAIHSREHHQLNQLIDDGRREQVREIEALVKERVEFARSRGPMRMLIATIALEHFTAMMAEAHARHRNLFENVDPGIERLWRWHAVEETEHKAVAYDVFLAATRHWPPWKRYFRRTLAMALITYYFTRNITHYSALLLQADGYSYKEAAKAVRRFVWRKPGLFARNWKTYFAWYRPGFHPWDNDNRALVADWKAGFDAEIAPA